MAQKRQIFIHIGSHKTGSTSIQTALKNNKDHLHQNGIDAFNGRPSGKSSKKTVSGNVWVKFDKETLLGAKVAPGLVPALSSLGDTVVFSAEGLSWIFSSESLADFHRDLSLHFDEIKIIVYLRRQDQQLLSHYQQASKNSSSPAYQLYGPEVRALPPHRPEFDYYLDYSKRIGAWADVFGDNAMIVRPFQSDLLLDGDVVADFFDILGVSLQSPQSRRNTSRSFQQTKVGLLMNRARMPREQRKHFLSGLDKGGKFLPTRGEAQELYAKYRASNIQLNQRFAITDTPHIFSEDFSRYPEQATENWTEESASDVIAKVLEKAAEIPQLDSADLNFLIRLAVKLEQDNMADATRLMQIAQVFKPNGPLIARKLEQYQHAPEKPQLSRKAGFSGYIKSRILKRS